MSDERNDHPGDVTEEDLEREAAKGPVETDVGTADVGGVGDPAGDSYAEREEAEDEEA